jgi:hypothetical protein
MICEQQYNPENIFWGQFIDLEIGNISDPKKNKSDLYSKSVTSVHINSPKKVRVLPSISEDEYYFNNDLNDDFNNDLNDDFNDDFNDDKIKNPLVLPSTEIKATIYNTCIHVSVISLMYYVLIVLI